MSDIRILLVEDNPTWQTILETHIQVAIPESQLQIATTFQDADRELSCETWTLLVTDIGLPPDSDHVLGINLVSKAKTRAVPCVVVSGTEAVTKQHVRDMLRNHGARDFFSKEELAKRPEKQLEFQEVIRECANIVPAPTVNEDIEPSSSPRHVVIGIKSESLYINIEGLEDVVIPSGSITKIFTLFALNVFEGLPAKVVKHEVLNQILDMPPDDKASQTLRNTINKLNGLLRKHAQPGDKTRWIIRGVGEPGYCLNTHNIKWDIEKALKKHLRSSGATIWHVLVDPQKMAAKTPDR